MYFYAFNLIIKTLLFKRRIESLADSELIERYQLKGDKELVGVLFKRYTRFVFAVCMKYLRNRQESEDAVMGVFESLFENLNRHNVDNFKSWLYTVSKNHCLHIIRNDSRRANTQREALNSGVPVMENITLMYHDSDDGIESKLVEMERELCNLTEEQQVCISLFYLKDKSYQEVAQITGYTLNQVKSYIQNGKRNLKNTLLSHEE